MAAVPTPRSVPSPSAADRRGVVESCRRYVAGLPAGDRDLLASFTYLEGCLTRWRSARLIECAGDPALTPPPAVPLGAFVRGFVRWLDAHPHRANEPVEWLVKASLRAR